MITQINIVKEPEYYYPAGMVEKDGLMTYPESQKLSSIPTPSSIVTKSSTAGLLKNDGTVDSNSYVKKSDIETEKTATGNPITLTDAIAGNALEVSAEIVASQDLHGYDKPWVGGAGINKYPILVGDDVWYTNVGASKARGENGELIVTCVEGSASSGVYASGGSSYKSSAESIGGAYYVSLDVVANTACTVKIGNTNSPMSVNVSTTPQRIKIPFSQYAHFVIFGDSNGVVLTISNFMVSAIDTDIYSPYENICPITGFSSVVITDVDAESHTATVTVSLGQTVYGGSLDLTSGELTIDKAIQIISSSNSGYVRNNLYIATALFTGAKSYANNEYPDGVMSNVTVGAKFGDIYGGAEGFTTLADGTGALAIAGISSRDAFNTFASSNTIQLVYPLATPTTTTLTAAQLALVKGYNQLSCNSGDIEITYKASSLDALKDRVYELEDRVDELEDAVEDIEDRVDDVETALAGKANVEPYFEQSVTLSTSQTTTVTFTDARILATSFIEPAISVWGIFPEDVTVANGSCTVVMPQVSSAQTVTVGIFIKR